jgi:hypothetical protein
VIKDISIGDTGKKGKGLFALRSFSKGEFIFRRRHGRVIRNEEIPSLSADEQIHLCELDWKVKNDKSPIFRMPRSSFKTNIVVDGLASRIHVSYAILSSYG